MLGHLATGDVRLNGCLSEDNTYPPDLEFMLDDIGSTAGVCQGFWSDLTSHPIITGGCISDVLGKGLVKVYGPEVKVTPVAGPPFMALGVAHVPLRVWDGEVVTLVCVVSPHMKVKRLFVDSLALKAMGLSPEYVFARRRGPPASRYPMRDAFGESESNWRLLKGGEGAAERRSRQCWAALAD